MLVCVASRMTHGATPPDLEARVRAIVEEDRTAAGTPAMSVAVLVDGRVAVQVASGMADLEARRPATTTTLFPAASLTKLLTAAMVMHEVEAGRLRLDMIVNEQLTSERQVRDVSRRPAPVTLRQLLSHSSGLPFSGRAIQTNPNEPPLRLDDVLSHGLVIVRPPGERLIYASDGFALAGWLAARAAGTDYATLARTILFDLLSMPRSTLVPPRDAGPDLAFAYEGTQRIPHPTVSGGAPAGALITTAAELGRFALMCLGRGELDGVRVLQPASIDEMLRLGARVHPSIAEGFGLGFFVRDTPGRKLAYWDGQLPGSASRLALLPDQGVGVVVLANRSDNAAVARVATRILDLLSPPPPEPRSDDVAGLPGVYRVVGMFEPGRSLLEWVANLTIEERAGALTMSSLILPVPARVIPLGGGQFRIEGTLLDGSRGIVVGDQLFVSVLQGRRVPVWLSAIAVFVYAGTIALVLLAFTGWLGVRFVRRRRAQRASTS